MALPQSRRKNVNWQTESGDTDNDPLCAIAPTPKVVFIYG